MKIFPKNNVTPADEASFNNFRKLLTIFSAVLCLGFVAGCQGTGISAGENSPYRLVDVRQSAHSMGLDVNDLNTAFARMSCNGTVVYVYAEPDGRVMVDGIEIAKDINIISDTVTIYIPVSVENKLRGALRFNKELAAKQRVDARRESRPIKKKPVEIPKTPWISNGVVLIDPGHGGRDPGAIGTKGTREKHIVLSVSQSLAAELAKKGYTVHMTRDKDVFITLDGRVAHASKLSPDLFVSIHADAAGNRSAKGMTIFVPRRSDDYTDSLRACKLVESYASRVVTENRGVRKHDINLRVLEKTSCPAMLIEVGFLSNPAEERNLNKAAYRKNLARAIARGVDEYLKKK